MPVRLPIVIGIHGVQQAGKDTTYGFIEEWATNNAFSVAKRGLADEMKWALAKLFFGDSISREDAVMWCDAHKLEPYEFIYDCPDEISASVLIDNEAVIPAATMRDLMRRMGTEVGRAWHEDFWLDKLIYKRHVGTVRMSDEQFDGAEICVITDVRFPNEVQRIHDNYGQAWIVRRKAAEDKVIADAYKAGKQLHVSDLLLPDTLFDWNFNNHTTVEELRAEVFGVMDEIKRSII